MITAIAYGNLLSFFDSTGSELINAQMGEIDDVIESESANSLKKDGVIVPEGMDPYIIMQEERKQLRKSLMQKVNVLPDLIRAYTIELKVNYVANSAADFNKFFNSGILEINKQIDLLSSLISGKYIGLVKKDLTKIEYDTLMMNVVELNIKTAFPESCSVEEMAAQYYIILLKSLDLVIIEHASVINGLGLTEVASELIENEAKPITEEGLTSREKKIMELIDSNKTYKEMTGEEGAGVSIATIKRTVKDVKERFRCNHIPELIIKLHSKGLIERH